MQKTVSVFQFADDIAVYLKFTSLKRGQITLEKTINIIKNNLLYLGLKFSLNKTVLIHFNNKGITPGNVSIRFDDYTIKSSKTLRFLGIVFN